MASDLLSIISLFSDQNLKTTNNIANQTSQNYEMLSRGLKAGADSLNSITSSVMNFKQLQVDEWYKSESLKQRAKEVEISRQQAGAELAFREKELRFRQDKADEDRQWQQDKLIQSEKNKEAYNLVGAQVRKYKALSDGFESETKLYSNEIDSIDKTLTAELATMSDSRMLELQNRKTALEAKRNDTISNLNKLSSTFSSLSIVKDGLISGNLDGDVAIKELSTLGHPDPDQMQQRSSQRYEDQDASGSFNQSIIPDENSIIPSGLGSVTPKNDATLSKINAELKADNNFINRQLPNSPLASQEKWSLQSTINRVARMSQDPRFSKDLGLSVAPLIQKNGDQETIKYFSDQREKLKKEWYEDRFVPFKFGDTDNPNSASKEFRLDQEKFMQKFALLGGTQDEIEELRRASQDDYVKVKAAAIAQGANADTVTNTIKQVVDDRFKSKETVNPNNNISSSGMLTATGTLAPLSSSGGFTFDLPKENIQSGDYYDRLNAVENDVMKQTYDKALTKKGGKTVLSPWALQQLNALTPEELGLDENDYVKFNSQGRRPKVDKELVNKARRKVLEDIVNRNDRGKALQLIMKPKIDQSR